MLLDMNALRPIRRVSQIRQYAPDAVPDDVLAQLLELARWTGSSRNSQPWHFVVVRDRDTLRTIASLPAEHQLGGVGPGRDRDRARWCEPDE